MRIELARERERSRWLRSRRGWRLVGSVVLGLAVAGCLSGERVSLRQAEPLPSAIPEAGPAIGGLRAWARTDGRRIAGNAQLTDLARADIAACDADTVPPPTGADPEPEGCMVGRGYYIRDIDG